MLNFLYKTSAVVDKMGGFKGHPLIVAPPKEDCFKVSLNKKGQVVSTVFLALEEAKGYRFYSKNNHTRAPYLRLDQVLSSKDKTKTIIQKLFRPLDELCEILGNKHLPLKELHNRLELRRSDAEIFFEEILNSILETKYDGIGTKNIVLLFENQTKKNDSLVFGDSSCQNLISLLRTKDMNDVSGNSIDIFGNKGTLVKTFPKIPRVGGMIQFAPYMKNNQTAAYARYGLNSTDACPVTIQNQQKIYDTLDRLTNEEFRDKIWHVSMDQTDKSRTLTLVCPDLGESSKSEDIKKNIGHDQIMNILGIVKDEIPEEDIELNEDETIQKYKKRAEVVISSLYGLGKIYPNFCYHIFVIKQFEKGAPINQVDLEIPFQKLIDKLTSWNKAVHLADNRDFSYFSKDSKKYVKYAENETIRPFEIPELLNRSWDRRCGIDASSGYMKKYASQIKHARFSLSDALNLFLSHDDKIAKKMLRQISRHHIWLMFDVAHRDGHRQKLCIPARKKEFGDHCRRDILKLQGLISLLYHIKENLMEELEQDKMQENFAYRMGKLLGIANKLNRLRFNKTSQYPASFVGEKFFPAIIRGHGIKTYWSQFVRRSSYLIKWSNKINLMVESEQSTGEQNKQISITYKWFQKEFNLVSGLIPEKFDATEKVLFASGYYSVR